MQTDSHDDRHGESTVPGHTRSSDAELSSAAQCDALLAEPTLSDAVAAVSTAPLAERAEGFEALHDRLLAELQAGDHGE